MEREITGSERAVWKRGVISLNLVFAAHLNPGILTAEELSIAWQILQHKHPLLNVHLEQPRKDVFFVTENTGTVPVRWIADAEDGQWRREALAELEQPFDDLSTSPLARCVLVHSREETTLILTAHHCICDGISMIFLVRDILNCLSGHAERVAESSPEYICDHMLPPDLTLPWWQRAAVGAANGIFRRLAFQTKFALVSMQENRLLAWNISRQQTADLLAACKRNRVTVHAAIAALFQCAQAEVQGQDNPIYNKIYTPVSLRHILQPLPGENFGLFAAESYLSHRYDLEKKLWKNAQSLQDAVAKSVTSQKILPLIRVANMLYPPLLDRLVVGMYKKQRLEFGYCISNLGNFSFSGRFGNIQLSGISAPVYYVQRAEKTLSIVTVGGTMFFSLMYRPGILLPETAEAVQRTAMDLLQQYTADEHVELTD